MSLDADYFKTPLLLRQDSNSSEDLQRHICNRLKVFGEEAICGKTRPKWFQALISCEDMINFFQTCEDVHEAVNGGVILVNAIVYSTMDEGAIPISQFVDILHRFKMLPCDKQIICKKEGELILHALLGLRHSKFSPIKTNEALRLAKDFLNSKLFSCDGLDKCLERLVLHAIRQSDEELFQFLTFEVGVKFRKVAQRESLVFSTFKSIQKAQSSGTPEFADALYDSIHIDIDSPEDLQLVDTAFRNSMQLPAVQRRSRCHFARARAMKHACDVVQFLRRHHFPVHLLEFSKEIFLWLLRHIDQRLHFNNDLMELIEESVIFFIGFGVPVKDFAGPRAWKLKGLNDHEMSKLLGSSEQASIFVGKLPVDALCLIFDFAYCYT